MRKKSVVLITVILVSLFIAWVLLTASGSEPQKEVMIKFAPQVSNQQIDSLSSAWGLNKIKSIEEINVEVFEVASEQRVTEVVQLASASPLVVYAEPSATVRALSTEPAAASPTAQAAPLADYKEGEIIIKFKSTVSVSDTTFSYAGLRVLRRFDPIGIYQCAITDGKAVPDALLKCNADAEIEYAEPNYIYHTFVTPNDPRFSELYGMTIIDAPEAWDVQTGSKSVIVGVIDTGVDTGHEDLQANIWSNPGETGGGKENNQVDDDNNGLVDDYRGWDFLNNDNNPADDNNHGSHCSGSIGGVGNNGKGVVGVNWNVSIMPLKFLGADGSGTTDDAVSAIIYGANMGAKVLSNSWGGGGRSQALEDAIEYANGQGVLFIAAAGNESSDNDRFASYPANYEVANVVSVAASTSSDNLASFSNYGKRTVHLAAPGNSILSTVANDRYERLSGTSMATPHVSGAMALVWAQFPALSANQIKIRVLGAVDRNSAFADRVITGGRLNVNKALSSNPIIANTTRLENTLDETGPYVVESDILDDGSVQNATLSYQVGSATAVTVPMTAAGADHYRGAIPGQGLGSTIVYFVSAADNGGNTTVDGNFTFGIAEPSNGGGCCGRPAVDVAIENNALRTTVNTALNLSIFLLPIAALKLVSNRRKKRR
ncbi:MAG TPA: S8 family peptidase [bacterium]